MWVHAPSRADRTFRFVQPPPLHADESTRLAALRRLLLLDSAPEERFDRIVRLASDVLGVPIAVVSLVDAERQWFKARIGLDTCETPRSVSFCGYAINEPSGRFVVEDALADPRFADNPLVLDGPRIRSYAGVVLHGPDGSPLGALAVADRTPRSFSDREIHLLEQFADLAEREVHATDAEQAHRAIARVELRKRLAMETFTEGIVFQAPDGRIVEWNSAAERVLGLSDDELAGRSSIDPSWRCIRADGTDWPGDAHPAMIAIRTGQPCLDGLMGVHRPAGDLVWLRVNSRPLFDDDGSMLGAFTAFQDITAEITYERRSAAMADRLTAAIEAGGVGTALLDATGRITFVNSALAAILDADKQQLKNRSLSDWFQRSDPVHRQLEEVQLGVRHVISADVCLVPRDPDALVVSMDGMPATTDARWIRLNLSRLPDLEGEGMMLAQVTDITVRRHLEADLARSEELARVCLDVLEQGIVFTSPTLGVLRVNPAAVEILGLPGDAPAEELAELRGRWTMLDEDLRELPIEEHPMSRALETGETVRDAVVWISRWEGDFVRIRHSVMPFGWTDEVVIAFTDITPYTRLGDPRPERVYTARR